MAPLKGRHATEPPLKGRPTSGEPSADKRNAADHAAAFMDGHDLIRRDSLDDLDTLRRPRHLEPVHHRRNPNPEMHPQVILREIARAGPHLADLRPPADGHTHTRP